MLNGNARLERQEWGCSDTMTYSPKNDLAQAQMKRKETEIRKCERKKGDKKENCRVPFRKNLIYASADGRQIIGIPHLLSSKGPE